MELYIAAYKGLGIPIPKGSTNGNALVSFFYAVVRGSLDAYPIISAYCIPRECSAQEELSSAREHSVTRVLFESKKAIGVGYVVGRVRGFGGRWRRKR